MPAISTALKLGRKHFGVLTIYNLLLLVVAAVAWPIVLPLVMLSEKRRKTVPYRLGFAPPHRAGGIVRHGDQRRSIWVHALSVGEVLSALPLIEGLRERYDRRRVFLSVSTLTGYELARARLSGSADTVFYAPYDIPFVIRRFADAVEPALMVIVETDIWPNTVHQMHQRRIPMVLANARLSPRTFSGYRRLRFIMGPTLGRFSRICTESPAEADRFRQLGVESNRLIVTGNVKFDQMEHPVPQEEISALTEQLGITEETSVLVAGSTHKGEEAILADAYAGIRLEYPQFRLIVVPRDPRRGTTVATLFSSAGFSCRRLNDSESPISAACAEVVIVDVIGALRALYRLSTISFVGGSLVPRGGHNPLEPAECEKPVIFGPHMTDFPDIASKLRDGGGAIEVRSAEDIRNAVIHLMRARDEAVALGRNAYAICLANQGAVAKTLNVIDDLLTL